MTPARALLTDLFEAAVAAAQPAICLPPHLPARPSGAGRLVVLALGKAAPGMALAAAQAYGPDIAGLVIAPHGVGVPDLARFAGLQVIRARHPVPDEGSLAAGQAALALADGLRAGDTLLALISGGGSSLMVAPVPGLALADKQAINARLLASGLPIGAINAVRQRLSLVKGGQLAERAAPAQVVTRVISDVPGDDAALIASGPTVLPRTKPQADGAAILAQAGIDLPAGVRLTVPPHPARGIGQDVAVIASADLSLAAAEKLARARGWAVTNLGGALEGDASGLAARHATLATSLASGSVILSGGEASVQTGPQAGRGGRNLTWLLALAIALDGAPGVHALACDTDGIDGTSPAAGALITPETLARARAAGLDACAMLAAHQSHAFFEALGDLVTTGPTGTNVNDFRVIIALHRQQPPELISGPQTRR
jgi:hydroxypyruvate reductase